MRGISKAVKIIIEGDFIGHIGTTSRKYDNVHGGFDFKNRNEGGFRLLDYVKVGHSQLELPNEGALGDLS